MTLSALTGAFSLCVIHIFDYVITYRPRAMPLDP